MTNTGVIHGRFQILHNDHLKYLLAGAKRCNHLVVGITNPDPVHTRTDASDPARSSRTSNPLTFFERYTMVRAVLPEAGLLEERFSVVPFPINIPELWPCYVPIDATFFLTIYDEWGRQKLAQFRKMGLKTEVLWERPLEEKGLTGTGVRNLIAEEGDWQTLVPAAVRELVHRWNLPRRIREAQSGELPDGLH